LIYDFRLAIEESADVVLKSAIEKSLKGQSAIANPKSPIANRQSQIANRKSPIANRKSQIENRKSKIANRKSQIENRKSKIVTLPDS